MTFWTRIRLGLRERRTIIGIACLALVVAFTGWRRLSTPESAPPPLPDAAVRGVDYTMDAFTMTLLNEQGLTRLHLRGDAMEHDPRSQRAEIESPRAMVAGEDGSTWIASADGGWIADSGDTILLRGAVEVGREATERHVPLTLQTETLTLYPERDVAETDAPVTITQPGATLAGRGLIVDMGRGHYELNARVRGQYDISDSP